ncbi:MAG: glycosyltransferase family 2 protein [Pirellulaceae bacterium]|nr:glycosyltransferase family 2 protein [Pirellulaceae bacterium]
MNTRWLAALPVYNEADTVHSVLDEVAKYAANILVVNDGSTDATRARLSERSDIRVVHHEKNSGYGAALKSAFRYAIDEGYEFIVTLDCDGQHQPKRIPRFISACKNADIVSGSRYLKDYEGDSEPPAQRMFINKQITRQVNERFGLQLTDAFCGFKAYRTSAIATLDIQNDGYAMPLELWTQAAMRKFRIIEIPVPRLYLDLNRSFGGSLDQAEVRLAYYNKVLDESVQAMLDRGFRLPSDDCPRTAICCGDLS